MIIPRKPAPGNLPMSHNSVCVPLSTGNMSCVLSSENSMSPAIPLQLNTPCPLAGLLLGL